MRKWLEVFKNLPPETRTLVALAGFGSFGAVAYGVANIIGKVLPPPLNSSMGGFLVLLLLVVLVTAISVGITKIAGGRTRKRSQKMAQELSGDLDRGPVSLDLRAIVKANNEKFVSAVRDMKKNAGLNVYDLPWYIIIGDSGCGKTKMINESGLTFSLGKPEGYQLGTLNYNWWFTEDAVFIDMAGKLCNPQDDADHKEWTSFLDTVGRGRPGFPINGAICCVSAEHLLQDPPEKVEQDANTMLERLRDLQAKLGVTFATYLVITKCDKILGFMQFFDRADRDITVKNQIVGWSRPGAFNELYDPEHFSADFDALYGRLNELRIRRLNDDADEVELGLAYAYPEQFRELQSPLETYLRTIFPAIKNPRAAKNLVFRGIFFTSATQQGGVILKHLMERLGADAAEHFPPLESLYPRPRPMFVKDLMLRKVFPEHGLVFRNEAQVIRNRKLSRLLRVGSSVLGGFLILIVGAGLYSFSGLIGKPRTDATQAMEASNSAEAVKLIGQLGDDITSLKETGRSKRLLYALAAPTARRSEPIEDLRVIQAGLFQKVVLPDVFQRVTENLQKALRADASKPAQDGEPFKDFKGALVEYVKWYSWADGPEFLDSASIAGEFADSLEKSFGLLLTFSGASDQKGMTAGDAKLYFSAVKDLGGMGREQWPNPARLLKTGVSLSTETIAKALEGFEAAMSKWTRMGTDHPDEEVRKWMVIHRACRNAASAYTTILGINGEGVVDLDSLAAFKSKEFDPPYGQFKSAMDDMLKPTPADSFVVCVEQMRNNAWGRFAESLGQAVAVNPRGDPAEQKEIVRLITLHCRNGEPKAPQSPRAGLDAALARGLAADDNNLLIMKDESAKALPFAEYRGLVKDVWADYSWIMGPAAATSQNDSGGSTGRAQLTPDAMKARDIFQGIADSLGRIPYDYSEEDAARTLVDWLDLFEKQVKAGVALRAQDGAGTVLTGAPWQPDVFSAQVMNLRQLGHQGLGTSLVMRLTRSLDEAAEKDWGLARLGERRGSEWISACDGFLADKNLAFWDKRAGGLAAAASDKGTNAKPAPPKAVRKGWRNLRERPAANAPKEPKADTGAERGQGILVHMTRDRLLEIADQSVMLFKHLSLRPSSEFDVLDELDLLPPRVKGDEAAAGADCSTALENAFRKYTDTYFEQWKRAYTQACASAESIGLPRIDGWGSLCEMAETPLPAKFGDTLDKRLSCLLQNTRWCVTDDRFLKWKNTSEFTSWEKLAGITERSRTNHFRSGSGQGFLFPGELAGRVDSDPRAPWEQTAGAAREMWMNWTKGLEDPRLRDLRGSFAKCEENEKLGPVEWPFERFRKQHQLGDELIMRHLVGFEKSAQCQLSRELTEVLCGLEKKELGDAALPETLPYAAKREMELGTGEVALNAFLAYLKASKKAKDFFGELDKRLSAVDAPGVKTRFAFYRGCDDWRLFLLSPGSGGPEPTKVTVIYKEDPFAGDCAIVLDRWRRELAFEDTPQNYFNKVRIDLAFKGGGKITAGTSSASAPDKEVQLEWEWSDGAGEPVQIMLEEPTQGTVPLGGATLGLGRRSAWALCELLERKGESVTPDSRREWVSVHVFEVSIQGRQKEKLGQTFRWKLQQEMPKPFARLKLEPACN